MSLIFLLHLLSIVHWYVMNVYVYMREGIKGLIASFDKVNENEATMQPYIVITMFNGSRNNYCVK
jgi:hypothetical protein